MTLAQLQSFVLAARYGSVKAAAAELHVSEAAVSVAVAALRRELGDELFVREGRGIALTAGWRRLATLGSEILALADQARRSVKDSPGRPRELRVAATGIVAEHVGPLIDAFATRDSGLEVVVERRRARRWPRTGTPTSRSAPIPGLRAGRRIASVPFLRCQLIIAAAPSHPLAGVRAISPAALETEHWLVGPPEVDPTTATGLFFARSGLEPPDMAAYTSHAAAAAGEGIVLSFAHSLMDEVRRRALVRLDVTGTPMVELWHASTLGFGRALDAALALQRFATSAEATQAMSSGRAGTSSVRAHPTVHVTLWRSIAEQIDAGRRR